MCLAVPTEVTEVAEGTARCRVQGGETSIQASLMLLDEEVHPGDYILIHAGFALRKLDAQEARETLKLMQEMAEHTQALSQGE